MFERNIWKMKNIVTALMQFVILVIALVIVTFAIPKIAGNDDRYDKYIAENSKQTVTVGSAFGVVKDGEKASYTDIDNSLKNIFSKVTPLQKPVNKILNRQISFKQAKYFEYYWLTALISGVLCWIFAAGFPFRIGRKGFNVFGSVYNNFSKVVLLEDEMTREEYEVDLGMTIWGPLWIILIALRATFAITWGFILPFVIAANLAIGVIRIVGNVIIVSVRGAAATAKRHSLSQKLDKTTFSIYPEGGYFRVEQDQDNGQGVYVKNYWNAVAAKALFESEAGNKSFSKEDSEENILRGDIKEKKFYETYRLLSRIKGLFNNDIKSKKAIITASLKNKEGGYEYRFIADSELYHVYMVGDEKAENLSHKDLKIDFNAAMLLDLLDFDRKGQRYDHNDFLNLYYADSDEFTAKLMNYNHKLIAKFGRNRYDEYFEQHKQQIIEHRRYKKLSAVGEDDE